MPEHGSWASKTNKGYQQRRHLWDRRQHERPPYVPYQVWRNDMDGVVPITSPEIMHGWWLSRREKTMDSQRVRKSSLWWLERVFVSSLIASWRCLLPGPGQKRLGLHPISGQIDAQCHLSMFLSSRGTWTLAVKIHPRRSGGDLFLSASFFLLSTQQRFLPSGLQTDTVYALTR
jgi:hypothetical protein